MVTRNLLVILATILLVEGVKEEVKFPKDQRTDYEFPQKLILPASPGLPMGHLRPIGLQRKSTGPVQLYKNETIPYEKPLLYKNILGSKVKPVWPKPAEIKKDASLDVMVRVVQKHHNGTLTHSYMKLSEFYEDYMSEEWWIDEVISPEQFELPDTVKLPCITSTSVTVTAGLTTGLLSSLEKNVNELICALNGRRDFIVMLKVGAARSESAASDSLCSERKIIKLNTELVNVFDHRWISAAKWTHATLEKGDCLHLPAGTMYHWISYGMYEGVTYSWHNMTETDNTESCDQQRPVLCPKRDGTTNALALCTDSNRSEEETFRRLLDVNMNDYEILSNVCMGRILKRIFNNKISMNEFQKLLETIPFTRRSLKKLSVEKLGEILKTLKSGAEKHHHSHDEL